MSSGRRPALGHRTARVVLVLLGPVLAAAAGCAGSGPSSAAVRAARVVSKAGELASAAPPARPSRPGSTLAPASAPFDVSAIIHRARFAYRPAAGGGFTGGYATYAVAVRGGKVRLTAYRYGSRVAGPSARPADPLRPDRVRSDRATTAVAGAPLEVETRSLRRGGHAFGRGAPVDTVRADGSLAIRRGAVVERLRNSADGVDQSWELESRPPGSGDLEVRVRLAGLAFTGRTAAGLHFVDARTGLGFRYGDAWFVDAAGARTPARAAWDGRDIVLRVPSGAVDRARYPATLDPMISTEFGLDQPVAGPSIFSQSHPAIASSGTAYLVVWDDARPPGSSLTRDVYGARVASDGTLLDPFGFPISQASGPQTNPAVASAGGDWLVVWSDGRNSSTTGVDVYGARVDAAGTVLDPDGFAVSTAPGDASEPAVASDGTDYLVTWVDTRSAATTGQDIYGARVTSNGVVRDSAGIAICAAPDVQRAPSVASNGSGWLVSWSDARQNGTSDFDVYAGRVASDGSVPDGSGFVVSAIPGSHQALSTVAGDGTGYLVAWEDRRGDPPNGWDIYAARLGAGGSVLDPAGVPVSTATGDQMAPHVASDGSGYFISWDDGRSCSQPCDVYGARVASDGTVLDAAGIPIVTAPDSQGNNVVAGDGTGYVVAWQDLRDQASFADDIYAARVGSDGTVADPDGFLVSAQSNLESFPSVATNGSDYFVAWHDFRNYATDDLDIYGVRVAPDGTVLDPSAIAIATGPGPQSYPSVASDGTDYLVAWSDGTDSATAPDVRAARVASDGSVMDTTPIDVSVGPAQQDLPRVASNGTGYLVVWKDTRVATNDYDVYGARVGANGTVLDPSGIPISAEPYNQEGQAVASNGSGYLVAWHDARDGMQFDVYATRVGADGTVLDPSGIVVSSASGNQFFPSLASDGTDYFAVWHDGRNGGSSDYDVYGARIGADGVVRDPSGIPIAVVAGSQQASAAVAFGGSEYLAVWRDARGGAYYDLYANRIDPDGSVLDGNGFVVSAEPGDEAGPALASRSAGEWLLAYGRTVQTAAEGVSVRVRARFIRDAVQCASNADCDDQNACTVDACSATRTCVHVVVPSCGASCSTDADCRDTNPCNGVETCSPTAGCQPGAPAADGTPCSPTRICISLQCVAARCGDGFVSAGEQCDDGNSIDGDGCDSDCTFSCQLDAECYDGDPCTTDVCSNHVCEHLAVPGCGQPDGGSSPDAGPGDAGMAGSDAGRLPGPNGRACGCAVPGAPSDDTPTALLGLLLLAFLLYRRAAARASRASR